MPSSELQTFKDFMEQAKQIPNIVIDADYAQPFRTYSLINESDVVLGKYSSVIEEAIAIHKPVLIHDYSPHGAGMLRPTAPYLPRELWALDGAELIEKVNELVSVTRGSVMTALTNTAPTYVNLDQTALAELLDGTGEMLGERCPVD